MTMVLSPGDTQVLSQSFSKEVPLMSDLSFSLSRAETKCMLSIFFYFSPLDVLKIIKQVLSFLPYKPVGRKIDTTKLDAANGWSIF